MAVQKKAADRLKAQECHAIIRMDAESPISFAMRINQAYQKVISYLNFVIDALMMIGE